MQEDADQKKSIISKTEILIITHASKNVSEQGFRDPLLYPGAPNTDLLSTVYDNLRRNTGITKAIISFDHKIDCEVSRLYLKNLQSFCREKGIRLVISPSSILMSNQLTATSAFMLGIKAVESQYVLFFEHDHLFRRELDWSLIDCAFEADAQMLRFNEFDNTSHENLREVVRESDFSKQVCETNVYCNKPFLSKTLFCRRLFELAEKEIPSWNGLFGGFIEGPVMRQIVADEFNLTHEEFRSKYPIYLYGGIGEPSLIEHFGAFPGRRARLAKAVGNFIGLLRRRLQE